MAHAQDASDSPATLPAFRTLYDDYFDFVRSWTRRMGVRADALEDVVQEIFLVVHLRVHTVERLGSLRSWLYSVVRRTVSTYHRSRRARSARESLQDGLGDSPDIMRPSPLEVAVLSDELQLVWRRLCELDAPKREVFILAEVDQMTAPEIAQAVGIPLNTVYSRLRIARHEFNLAYMRASSCARRRPDVANRSRTVLQPLRERTPSQS
jgi:RNA polymerase sigma-70 factor (ECF subfamily)